MNTSLSMAAPWWRPNTGQRLMIRGGRPLVGMYPISGAKNAVLPLMVSALLTPHLVTLRNVPANLDVAVLAALLQRLGCDMHWSTSDAGLAVTIAADRVQPQRIDRELVSRMRASLLLLGALLARCGEAALPMPGGDAIGLRGIDFHVAGLRAMGATIELSDGTIRATARDLASWLIAMGARFAGLGTHVLAIEGGALLGGSVHAVLPDRIEFGTLACAAALTDGELLLAGGRVDLLGSAAASFDAAGVDLRETEDGVVARRARDGLIGVDLTTAPYPGFATDLQAPTMALLTSAAGTSTITENIFEQRFRHVDELRKMGADIAVRGRTARIRGVERLRGAAVTCTDVRAAAALVLAGLGASGETALDGLEHLDRGYDGMTAKLAACGAHIERR